MSCSVPATLRNVSGISMCNNRKNKELENVEFSYFLDVEYEFFIID